MLLAEGVRLLPDKTFFIQLGFFLVLLFVMTRFVFKPILKVLELRKLHTEGEKKKIEDLAKRTEGLMKEYETKLTAAHQEAIQVKEAIRREGQEAGSKLVSESKEAAKNEIERVKKEITESATKAKTDLEKQAKQLGTEIAGKVLGRNLTGNGH